MLPTFRTATRALLFGSFVGAMGLALRLESASERGVLNQVGAVLADAALGRAAQADTVPPDQVLQNTVEQMRGLIQKNAQTYKTDKAKFYATVDEILVPHFDQKYVAQLILGRNWREANEDQRTRFQNAFKSMLVRSYADELLDNYDTAKIEYRPLKLTDGQTDATVSTSLQRANVAQPTKIDFQVHLVNGDWKVYDVTVENISLVTNFRTQVGSEIKKTGLDDVIARMEKGQLLTDPGLPKSAAKGK